MLAGVRKFRKLLPSVIEKGRFANFGAKAFAVINDQAVDPQYYLSQKRREFLDLHRRNTSKYFTGVMANYHKVKRTVERIIRAESSLEPDHPIITLINLATTIVSYLLIFLQSIKLGYQEDLFESVPFFGALKIIGKKQIDQCEPPP